jgi:hypothetical protein
MQFYTEYQVAIFYVLGIFSGISVGMYFYLRAIMGRMDLVVRECTAARTDANLIAENIRRDQQVVNDQLAVLDTRITMINANISQTRKVYQ